MKPAAWFSDPCPSHPNDEGWHECMVKERRCVYCGVTLQPVPCHGCGRFLSCQEMIDNESRCRGCM